MEVARILDANFNRASEALRVLEDIARLSLCNGPLTAETRQLRHEVGACRDAVSKAFPLMKMRRAASDVGLEVSSRERRRQYAGAEVVDANFHRVHESLRVIEEFLRCLPTMGISRQIEAMRFRSYSLEQSFSFWVRPSRKIASRLFHLVLTRALCNSDPLDTVRQGIASGVDVVQLREKEGADRRIVSFARELRELTFEARCLLIINDRPDIAVACRADGVHLGQDDIDIEDARRVIGPDAIVGSSAHSPDEAIAAQSRGADYVGVGAVYRTLTKLDAKMRGLALVRRVARAVTIPVVGIGGITPRNAGRVIVAGASAIAVSAAILSSGEPGATARAIRKALDRAVLSIGEREKREKGRRKIRVRRRGSSPPTRTFR